MRVFSSRRPDRCPHFLFCFGFLFSVGGGDAPLFWKLRVSQTEIHPSGTKRRVITVIPKTHQQRHEVVRRHTFSPLFLLADDFYKSSARAISSQRVRAEHFSQ